MTLSHLFRRLPVLGQMNIQSCSRVQSLLIDRSDILLAGTMPERFRRLHLFQFHIDRDRMSLICPDQRPILIKRITLFLIRADDQLQNIPIELLCLCDTRDQLLHIRPPMLIQLNTDDLRFVA